MDTIGIIGGIGPESTIEYYRQIIATYRTRHHDGSYPRIIINSINMTYMLDLISADRLADVSAYLRDEVSRLAGAGADVGVLASNTPHLVFDEIRNGSPIPMISIVEATCKQAKRLGFEKLGLFGTKFTMQSVFYPDVFAAYKMTIVTPDSEDQAYIHNTYMEELVNGIIRDDTKDRLLEIASALESRHGIQGLILGGTELPLILKDGDATNLPFLDTTKIHVETIVEYILN